MKIAPAHNGICGSDLHLYHGGPIPPAPTADEPHPLSGETLPDVLGPGRRLEVVAIHSTPIQLDITKSLTMQDREMGSSVGCAGDHEEAIELVRSGRVDLSPYITSRITADAIMEKGFHRPLENNETEVKIVVSMS